MLREIYRFLGLSGVGWILDFTTFALLGLILNNLFTVSIISALVGASFVFILSPKLIFKNKNNISLKIKYIIYISYQILLILFISYLIIEVEHLLQLYLVKYLPIIENLCYLLSKIFVTPVAMISNFLVLKIVIEKI